MTISEKGRRSRRGSKIGLAVLFFLAACGVVSRWITVEQGGVPSLPPLRGASIDLHAISPMPLSDANRLAPFHGVTSCNIGYINGQNFGLGDVTVPAGVVGLGGWLVDEANHVVPRDAHLVFFSDQAGQGFSVPVSNWLTRPDVQDFFGGLAAYRRAGFVEDVNLSHLPVGRYHLYMTLAAGSLIYTCDNGRYINLTVQG